MTVEALAPMPLVEVPHASVALLTNFLPPYRISLLEALESRVGSLRIFLSTRMEANRAWPVEWRQLDVTLQRSLSFRQTWRHPNGFSEPIFVQIPYDTLWALSALRPHVVVSSELGLRTVLATMYRWLAPHSRLIVWATISEHSEQGRGRLRELMRGWILRQADAVLVNGESGARYIRRFGVPEACLFRVPYTSDPVEYETVPLERAADAPHRLLYVGQLVERKGLDAFFTALRQWGEEHPERRLEFWLVGDGPLRHQLERLALPDNVACRFLGNLPYDELPALYAQADLFVLPTLADEWGLVVNEAMAAGLPVLGSLYSQAVEELVVEEQTGWTFRPDHGAETLAALERALATSHAQLEPMRQAARQRVASLTPDAVAERMTDALRFVLTRGPR